MHYDDWKDAEDDGDTFTLDGKVYRLRIEPDLFADVIRDSDYYGALAFVDTRHDFDNMDWERDRPDGFTGNAEKLSVPNCDPVWWEPPKDVPRTSEHFATFRRALCNLLEFGYYTVGLEELEGEDAYGRPIVVRTAWLGMVEPWEYGDGTLPDLLRELHNQITDDPITATREEVAS